MSASEYRFGLNNVKKLKEFQKSEHKPNKIKVQHHSSQPTESLPEWFKSPIKVPNNEKAGKVRKFSLLDEHLRQRLRKNKIRRLFPIQQSVLPYLLAPQNPYFYLHKDTYDICVSSPTGSGKTLLFVLSIIQALRTRLLVQLRALVVVPVTDLGVQIHSVFKEYSSYTDLSVVLLGSGTLSFQKEQKRLVDSEMRPLADVVISTPGRLVDHIRHTRGFSLNNLRFLVIDEADRMLRDDKHQWIVRTLPSLDCQKLLFSATLTHEPDKLASIALSKPKLFTSASGSSFVKPGRLKESYVIVDENTRPLVVVHMMTTWKYDRVVCFVNSVLSANRLSLVLTEYGISDLAILTSHQPPKKRASILKNFNSNSIKILICSDMATRGIDFGDVKYVISYDYCKHLKTYIHRIGRTARAGHEGTSIILLNKTQLRRFMRQTRQSDGKTVSIKELKVNEKDIRNLANKFEDTLLKVSNKLNS